ncbi:MAG: S1 RNA-binding domain-containing protein [Brevefilum sp.]|nr:S1 RNA-binding domain-containing protein [Brevefilum sp.]MDT8380663.1 S1 RNA-binding domain-containing protein [Brevefilum sp.]
MDQNEILNTTGEEEGEEESTNKMEALLAEEGLTIDFPKRGEIRKGTIASISDGQILVSVGAKSEGILAGKELDSIDDETVESWKVGDEIKVFVVTPEDSNGNLILSFNRALEEENWQTAEELLESNESFTSKIEGYNKGGLLVPLGTIRGFVPASQIGLGRRLTITGNSPDERYSEMVGEEIEVCVIEVDRDRRRLILSERAASSETRDSIKERVIDELEEGEIRTGRVTSLADFGAFVNINGADGLVHLSELSWEHINHPSEVLEVGQEIKVKVISIDEDRKRIGLSIRRLKDDPWEDQIEALTEGQLVEGKITRLTNFGAFARLLLDDVEGDLEGLIHISEISERRIEHPKEILKEGEVVTLRIIKIEEDTHRIGLSMRRVDSPAYTDLDWKTLTDEFDVEDLSDELAEAKEKVEETSEDLVEDAGEKVEETKAQAEEVVEDVVEEGEELVEETLDKVEETKAQAEEVVEDVVEEAEELVEETLDKVEETKEQAEEVVEGVVEEAEELVEETLDKAEDAGEKVAETVEDVVEDAEELVEEVVEDVKADLEPEDDSEEEKA